MRHLRVLFGLCFIALISLFALPSLAADTGAIKDVRLIAGAASPKNPAVRQMLLEVSLAEGWHTYWRTPGPTGLPPKLTWKAGTPDDALPRATEFLYLPPKRSEMGGIELYGYAGTVRFPLRVTVSDPAAPLRLQGVLDILVCSDICVPETRGVSLSLPASYAPTAEDKARVDEAFASLPQANGEAGIRLISLTPDAAEKDSLLLRVALSDAPSSAFDVFLEPSANFLAFAPKKVAEHDGQYEFRLRTDGVAAEQVGVPVTVTYVDGAKSVEAVLNITPAGASDLSSLPPAATAGVVAPSGEVPLPSLWFMVIFALLGGLILNLMPCVLPVLSLKVLSVLSHGGTAAPRVRLSFLASSAGILVSFLILALLVVGLKDLGHTAGWGVQFQNPFFLTFLLLVLTLFTGNLWGLFEIQLPRVIADRLSGSGVSSKLMGDFLTGMLATLLATPCTAPFLGTAVGFALASDAAVIFLIFSAMGLGLALPYLLIAAWPQMAARLPKPGAWMLRVKFLMGVALSGTALWLLWVLSAQLSLAYTGALAVLLLLLLGALALLRMKRGRVLAMLLAILSAVGAMGVPALHPKAEAMATHAGRWHAFDEAAIAGYVAEGKVVFVDVTADWCITCQVNKRFVLYRPGLAETLFAGDIVAMQADWTLRNEAIGAYLQKHQRAGIPFNIVYGPAALQGIVLPELLTEEAVRKALAEAAGAH